MSFLHKSTQISLISILCTISSTTYSRIQQQIDSLKQVTVTIADAKLQVDNLNKLAYWFGGDNLHSPIHYCSKAAEKAIVIHFRKEQALAYNYKA